MGVRRESLNSKSSEAADPLHDASKSNLNVPCCQQCWLRCPAAATHYYTQACTIAPPPCAGGKQRALVACN